MRNKHRVLSSAAPACILGFKLTLLAVSLIGFQLRDTNIELEESRAKTASATTKPIAGLHSVGPQYVDRELSPADFKHLSGHGRRASHTVVPDGDEHSRQKAAILSSSEEEQEEKPSSEKNPHEHPLSWDKSWWTFGAWLLWILSCVTPTVLIFVLNGMTQASFESERCLLLHRCLDDEFQFKIVRIQSIACTPPWRGVLLDFPRNV
jgi:hypothetical protein